MVMVAGCAACRPLPFPMRWPDRPAPYTTTDNMASIDDVRAFVKRGYFRADGMSIARYTMGVCAVAPSQQRTPHEELRRGATPAYRSPCGCSLLCGRVRMSRQVHPRPAPLLRRAGRRCVAERKGAPAIRSPSIASSSMARIATQAKRNQHLSKWRLLHFVRSDSFLVGTSN